MSCDAHAAPRHLARRGLCDPRTPRRCGRSLPAARSASARQRAGNVALARAGRIRIEVYAHNWRVVEILSGPNKGKRTAPCPNKTNGPYLVIEKESRYRTRRFSVEPACFKRRTALSAASACTPRTQVMTHLRIISLGAGVQSTTMALMAAHGEIGLMPDCAIFADTQDEPQAVYDHLAWLMSPNVLPFPVHITTHGRLSDALRAGNDEARIPSFVGAGGLSGRQCTRNFKIRPIRRKVRDLLGVGPRGYVAPGTVEVWIGISTDEAIRKKPSGVRYIVNRHPLIEKWMSRADCVAWLKANDYPEPPKSACIYCPFQGNAGWRRRREQPSDWVRVVDLDRWLREPEQVARFRGELYLHESRRPLDAADLTEPSLPLFGGDFSHECEGMCGV
jgi:hypothetical protein